MKIAKRYLALVLSFALFLALPLAFTQEAAAASKGTKILQPSMMITSNSYNGLSSSSFRAFSYNDKGLMSAAVNQSGSMEAYAYNKSGYMTSSTKFDNKSVPYEQTMYDVKKGKVKGITKFGIDGANVTLKNFSKISYKKGKVSQVVYSTADGKISEIATYKKGVLSKVVRITSYSQSVALYDKYGNRTSLTIVDKDDNSTDTTVYKNTYKSGKLVKVVSSSANSSNNYTETGLKVYTYKKGRLVREDAAYTYSWAPDVTYGDTTTYAYTKGGLISNVSTASLMTTATESKVYDVNTAAYQYKKVAVNKKCVPAVEEAMEDYSYENFLPGNEYYPGDWY